MQQEFVGPDADIIALSPHPDDVVLSCGGALHRLAVDGARVAVVTVFGASPPLDAPLSPFAQSLHDRWQQSAKIRQFDDPPACRRDEDQQAIAALHPAITLIHWPLADCIYRRDVDTGEALYASEEGLFGVVAAGDPALRTLTALPSPPPDATIYAPLTVGHHVDHQVIAQAVAAWNLPPDRVRFYEDYPYVAEPGALQTVIGDGAGWQSETIPLSEAALAAKVRAVAAHESQISTFWTDLDAMEAAIRAQAARVGGERFWRRGA